MKPNIQILVNDKPIKTYAHDGRLFVEARDNCEYAIKLINPLLNKTLAVVSIDGLNVVNGEPCSDHSPGYVLNGLSSYAVKGYRTSNQGVNAFRFGKKQNSYAAKHPDNKGDTTNCGVIGAKFFLEKVYFNIEFDDIGQAVFPFYKKPFVDKFLYENSCDTYCACGAASPSPVNAPIMKESLVRSFSMGTEFTNKYISDKVKETTFDRGEVAIFIEIFYATRDELEAMGIKIDKEPEVNFPKSFPASFCKPPKS